MMMLIFLFFRSPFDALLLFRSIHYGVCQPFADPNAKKKYTQISYAAHVQSAARSLIGSTMFGIAMTCGLYYYWGTLTGLAMQVVMAPLNLWENPLVKSILKGVMLAPENTVFDEKLSLQELGDDVEVVDEQGRVVVVGGGSTNGGSAAIAAALEPLSAAGLKTLLLDTWDAGAKADVAKLVSCLTKDNCNTTTDPDRWTALMILSGLKHTPEASLQKCLDLGAKVSMTDADGWTCLHWAAFHGNETAAAFLVKAQPSLATVLDAQQQTPLEVAMAEKSDDVIKVLQQPKEVKKNQ
jgi:hypothetical protein